MGPQIFAVLLGILGTRFPRVLIDWMTRAVLGPGFENASELQPREWYVTTVRMQSILVVLTGLLGVLLKTRSDTRAKADRNLVSE